jgi:hypothetical protein
MTKAFLHHEKYCYQWHEALAGVPACRRAGVPAYRRAGGLLVGSSPLAWVIYTLWSQRLDVVI